MLNSNENFPTRLWSFKVRASLLFNVVPRSNIGEVHKDGQKNDGSNQQRVDTTECKWLLSPHRSHLTRHLSPESTFETLDVTSVFMILDAVPDSFSASCCLLALDGVWLMVFKFDPSAWWHLLVRAGTWKSLLVLDVACLRLLWPPKMLRAGFPLIHYCHYCINPSSGLLFAVT